MTLQEEKINLLSEMIAFALVDGELHTEEINFLTNVAESLEISKTSYLELFSKSYEPVAIKDPFTRIVHFYELALLMHCDNRLHINEKIAINQIGIRMGLSLHSMHVILEMVSKSPDANLPVDALVSVYQLQHN
jgi:Tellurite resistance protein TerB